MKYLLARTFLAGILVADVAAARQGPEVRMVDQKVSVHADNITLGFLLQLWDKATGMQSTIPRDLAKRTLSVQFDRLSVEDAVQKIFEKQPLNYIVVAGKGIMVTGLEKNLPPPPAEGDVTEQPEPQGPPEGIVTPIIRQKPAPVPPPLPEPTIPGPVGTVPAVSEELTPTPMVQPPPVVVWAPGLPFYGVPAPVVPPSGAANGPPQNMLFGPLPMYQEPITPQQRP
jgi:hypothetical protein